MHWKMHPLLVGALVAIVASAILVAPQTATTVKSGRVGNLVLARALDIELGAVERRPHEQLVSSGALLAALEATGELERRADRQGKRSEGERSSGTLGCTNTFGGRNTRVNQDCSLRRQAEEVIVVNPTNPKNLIAGQNDSRIGFNHCGYDWSFDGGKTWGDQVPPFWQFQLLDGRTTDACSDPTATFDSVGNAYVGGVIFNVLFAANAVVVAKSNAPIGGAFYHSPAALSFQTYRDIPLGVVANDNNENIFHDKELMVADANPSGPKRNNVYMTWTRFDFATGAGVGAHSPIFFSQSTNGGATWSPGVEISGASGAVCTVGSAETSPNACDQDQGSHPVVGPDGTIYVGFINGNTPLLGVNQHLIVKCLPTANCALSGSWTTPVKTGDDIGKQPVGPNPATGCPGGRQCLPPNGYRVQDDTTGSLSVDRNGKLYAVWADFRNGVGSSCDWNNAVAGRAATATPPCDNDIFYSTSIDGGATWSAAFNVTPRAKFGPSAQWQPWSAVTSDGKRLWIAYYDRSFGNCETTGCNDITLASVSNPASSSPKIKYKRLTTSSMPNLVPANNPLQAGFLGDYMWVTVDNNGHALVVWADTRGRNGTVEEDIYFARSGSDEDHEDDEGDD